MSDDWVQIGGPRSHNFPMVNNNNSADGDNFNNHNPGFLQPDHCRRFVLSLESCLYGLSKISCFISISCEIGTALSIAGFIAPEKAISGILVRSTVSRPLYSFLLIELVFGISGMLLNLDPLLTYGVFATLRITSMEKVMHP